MSRTSLCMECGNSFPSKCEKVRSGKKVYDEAEPVVLSQQRDCVRVTKCSHYVPDRSVAKPVKGKKGERNDNR